MENQPHFTEIRDQIAAAIRLRGLSDKVSKYEPQGIQIIVKNNNGEVRGRMVAIIGNIVEKRSGMNRSEISSHEIQLRAEPLVEREGGESYRQLMQPKLRHDQGDAFAAEMQRITGNLNWGFQVVSTTLKPVPISKPSDPRIIALRQVIYYDRQDQLPAHSIALMLELGSWLLINHYDQLVALEFFGKETGTPPIS